MSSSEARVLLFATLRELAGTPATTVDVTEHQTVEDCWELLCRQFPALQLQRALVRPALNRTYVGWDAPVASGDELAFLPPVSGGSGR